MAKLILASSSLGRKKLLDYLKIPFVIMPSNLDEDKIIGKTPIETISLRAKRKGEAIAKTILRRGVTQSYLVLSADSDAVIDEKVVGKASDKKRAIKILKSLSGRTHDFYTAVYIIKIDKNKSKDKKVILEKLVKSTVTFRKLSQEDIDFYLKVTDYKKFAGSYALISAQDFITKIQGSLSNVIGLPLEIVIPILKKYL